MIKRVALILLLLFFLHVPAFAANFVEVHRDDQRLMYVDTDSIGLRTSPNNDEYVVAWIKNIARGGDYRKSLSESYGEGADHYIFFQAYNKDLKQAQLLLFCVGYKNGDTQSITSPITFEASRYQEIIPGTFSEKIYDFVMKHYNENKK